MIKVIAAVTKPGIGDDDIDAAKFLLGAFEKDEELVPIARVCFLEEWTIDGFCWSLDVAYEDFGSCFGEVVDDALTYATTAASDYGGFALQLIAWVNNLSVCDRISTRGLGDEPISASVISSAVMFVVALVHGEMIRYDRYVLLVCHLSISVDLSSDHLYHLSAAAEDNEQ